VFALPTTLGPALGRFLQPDSIVPGTDNPQAWNRYTYVLNSPIVHNDPSGHERCSYDDRGCDSDGDTGGGGSGNGGTTGGGGGNSGGGHGGGNNTPENVVSTVVNSYMSGWNTFGAAWSNARNPNASIGSKIVGNYYMTAWLASHVLLGVGVGMAAVGVWQIVAGATTICEANAACENEVSTDLPKFSNEAYHIGKHVTGTIPKLNGVPQDMPEFSVNPQEYIEAGKQFMSGPIKNGIMSAYRSGGDLIRFQPSTGYFGTLSPDNIVRTFFRPDGSGSDQLNYFLSQLIK